MSATPRAQRGGTLGMLLALLTSALLIVVVLEAGMRLLPIPGAAPVVTINEPDSTLGWVKRKGDSTHKETAEYDVVFSINRLGLRDDEDLSLEKPDGVRRILVVGDSFVLGYTVSRDELFVDLLEQSLCTDRDDIQVLNGGTEGYSTDQELLWLRTEGLRFEPDVVVVCFYQNDVYWNGQTAYAGKAKPRFPPGGDAAATEGPLRIEQEGIGWLARNTALGGFLQARSNPHLGEMVFRLENGHYLPREEAVVLIDAPATLDLDGAWARTQAVLRGFAATCTDAGVKLLFTAIPSREQVQPASAELYLERYELAADAVDFDQPTGRALAAAMAAGITTLDPLPELREAAQERPLYFERDWHLNGHGNRVLARVLYERLAADDFLGTGASPRGLAALAAAPAGKLPRWPFVIVAVWILLASLYARSYRDESVPAAFLKVGALIALVVGIVLLVDALLHLAGPAVGAWVGLVAVVAILGLVLWKSRQQLGIITEVYASFVRSGHWYMIPLLVAMLTIGSLLVVASSSPFIAPFIYTLF